VNKPRVIQKYPNRRMYDTLQHRYVTLDEILRFVLTEVDFIVVDKRDQSDITFDTLLNVLSKVYANRRQPGLDRQFLLEAIRAQSAYSDPAMEESYMGGGDGRFFVGPPKASIS
jgi:polyhydroxyalkanoate synthesis repressor PhaR